VLRERYNPAEDAFNEESRQAERNSLEVAREVPTGFSRNRSIGVWILGVAGLGRQHLQPKSSAASGSLLPGDELVRSPEEDLGGEVPAQFAAQGTLDRDGLKWEFPGAGGNIAAARLARDDEGLAGRWGQEHGRMIGEIQGEWAKLGQRTRHFSNNWTGETQAPGADELRPLELDPYRLRTSRSCRHGVGGLAIAIAVIHRKAGKRRRRTTEHS
jgi:hypothetical protein